MHCRILFSFLLEIFIGCASFKNDRERSDPGKYCPISLLPIISKIFESFINDSLTKHLDITCLFSDLLYGFHTFRSTADILYVLGERIYNALDADGEKKVIEFEISKAFDNVCHICRVVPQAKILWCCWPYPKYLGILFAGTFIESCS